MGTISYEYLTRSDGPVTSHVLADVMLKGDHLEGIVCDVQGKILGSYKANCPSNTCTRSIGIVHKLISEGEDMVSSKTECGDDDDGFTRTVFYLQQSSPLLIAESVIVMPAIGAKEELVTECIGRFNILFCYLLLL